MLVIVLIPTLMAGFKPANPRVEVKHNGKPIGFSSGSRESYKKQYRRPTNRHVLNTSHGTGTGTGGCGAEDLRKCSVVSEVIWF